MVRTLAFTAAARRLTLGGMDIVLPSHCGACDAPIDVPGRLCAECWSKVDFITATYCARCGTLFEIEAGARCAACIQTPPGYRRARAAILYHSVGRDLILALKLTDRTSSAPAFGDWRERAGVELLADADFIALVPLHRWSLMARSSNQSALLMATVSRDSGTACIANLLIRARATRSQARLSASERRKNVQDAFRLRKRHAKLVQGKSILLVDDVITTGATAEACVQALLRGGAAHVDVLTLARTQDRST